MKKLILSSLVLIGILLTISVNAKATLQNETVNGNIEWNNENNYNLNFNKVSFVNGLLWANDIKGGKKFNYYAAKSTCENMSYNQQGVIFNQFRLATTNEWEQSFKKKNNRLQNMRRKKFYTSSSKRCDKIYKKRKRVDVMSTHSSILERSCQDKQKSKSWKSYRYKMHSLCITTKLTQSVTEIAKKLQAHTIKNTSNLSLPIKPIKQEYKKLIKDEFETTKTFNNRVKALKNEMDNNYKQSIKQWEKEIEYTKQQHKLELEKLEHNKEKDYLKYLQQAMHIKYGNPKIGKVKYDADTQLFNIELKSTRSNYSKTVQQFVQLKYAKKFKNILINKNFKPTILFHLDNNEIKFSGIKEIKDPEILVEENESKYVLNDRLTFEVENSFGKDDVSKGKGLVSRHKAIVKDMNIKVHATMKNRPLKDDYIVKVRTNLVAIHACTKKNKTSYNAKGCDKVDENREISMNELTLTKQNNWSTTFEIKEQVSVFGVKENAVARYEVELEKLDIVPEVLDIKTK